MNEDEATERLSEICDTYTGPKRIQEARKLIEQYGADVMSRSKTFDDSPGTTLLHRAARDRDLEMCRLLIDNGADVNATYGDHKLLMTPLQLALARGQETTSDKYEVKKIVRLLVEHGANVSAPYIKLGQGRAPCNNPLVIEVLDEKQQDRTDTSGRKSRNDAARRQPRETKRLARRGERSRDDTGRSR